MPSAANNDEAKLAIINLSCDELPPKLGPRRGLPGIVNRLLDYLDILIQLILSKNLVGSEAQRESSLIKFLFDLIKALLAEVGDVHQVFF